MKKIIILCLVVVGFETAYGTPSNNNSNSDKPSRLYVESDTQTFHYNGNGIAYDYYDGAHILVGTASGAQDYHHTWTDGAGGGGSWSTDHTDSTVSDDPLYTGSDHYHVDGQFSWAATLWPTLTNSTETDTGDTWLLGWADVDVGLNPWQSDDLPLIEMEHCKIKDTQSTWVGTNSYSHYDFSRTAQTKMKLETGGKALSKQKNLFAFNGSATEILANFAIPPFTGLPTQSIPSQGISIGSVGVLGSDGNLYVALPDNQTFDVTPTANSGNFYIFGLTANKYHAYIGLATSTTNANLDTDTPEVCVGQTVTLGADWLGGVPTCTNIDDVRWHLPDKYVNQQINYATNCVTYVQNTDLLTNTAIQCWYVNLPGGDCSVRETLHFANGQSVNIAAAGSFTIFRPKVYFFADGGANVVLDTSGSPSIYLGVGDNSTGAMGWRNIVDLNPKYPASIYYTQLIYRNWDWDRQGGLGAYLPKSDHTDGYLLDTEAKYSAATIINNSGSNFQVELHFGDGPDLQDTLHSFADCQDKFETYLEFQPIGGIPITLGVVDWGWHGKVDGSYSSSTWSLTTNSISGPSFYDYYDDFPEWPSVYTGN